MWTRGPESGEQRFETAGCADFSRVQLPRQRLHGELISGFLRQKAAATLLSNHTGLWKDLSCPPRFRKALLSSCANVQNSLIELSKNFCPGKQNPSNPSPGAESQAGVAGAGWGLGEPGAHGFKMSPLIHHTEPVSRLSNWLPSCSGASEEIMAVRQGALAEAKYSTLTRLPGEARDGVRAEGLLRGHS